jgi:DNA mismatch repair protein MutS2
VREKDLFLLEFDKVRAALRSHCASEPGREASLCISPAFDRERIGEQLDWVDQCLSLLKQGIEIPLADFPRLDSWLLDVQAEGAFLEGKQLAEILSTAKLASNMRDFLRGLSDAYASLKKFSSSLHRIPLLEASLGKALEQDGSVKSSATPQLHAIRKTQAELKGRLSDRLHRLLRSRELRQLQQDPLVTLRNDRFVVTVPSDALHQIPGVVQDRSSSGKTCYVEPLFALEMNNKLLLSKREEREEEIQILRALTDEVKAKAGDLQEIFSALRKVDLIQARARLALQWNGVKPEMGGSVILLRQARHPLLLLSRRETVPVDISIPEGKRGLILTGPNMGGKTVCLKTLGLLALMAQAGFLIPAERGARLPVFDGVFTDIGDEQALESSLSTFSAHLTNLKEIY